jgi:UDP-N-acetylglucosamine enolpyruvyl transferase
MTVRSFTPSSRATAALPRAKIRAPKGCNRRERKLGLRGELLWIRYGSMGEHRRTRASQREDQRGQQRAASARSVGPRRNKWVVLNIQATATIAPNVADRADVVSSIELASAKGVAIQTGTTSACSICSEHGRKKESSDNKPELHHKSLHDALMLNNTAASALIYVNPSIRTVAS